MGKLSDQTVFKIAGWSGVIAIAFFAWQEWRTRTVFAKRGKGTPIIDTTGIRG